ncbi:hypothetical protein, partial [Streptomyces sp. NPDC059349]|uniref:hypothetical protein n=1 Tax=Streptomyces sp. NPDC059349 TaxID=3346808 RepID=UPI00369BD83C
MEQPVVVASGLRAVFGREGLLGYVCSHGGQGLPHVLLSGLAPVLMIPDVVFGFPGLVFGWTMPGMRRMRMVGSILVAVLVVGGAAGCSGDDSSGKGGKPSVSAAKPKPVAPRDALAAYEQETVSGCTDADDCQQFMTRKLAAAVKVREAMEAKDRQTYAEPIG